MCRRYWATHCKLPLKYPHLQLLDCSNSKRSKANYVPLEAVSVCEGQVFTAGVKFADQVWPLATPVSHLSQLRARQCSGTQTLRRCTEAVPA